MNLFFLLSIVLNIVLGIALLIKHGNFVSLSIPEKPKKLKPWGDDTWAKLVFD